MSTPGEDQKRVPDARTPITIPTSPATVDLTGLFSTCDGGQAYARRIVNPTSNQVIVVSVISRQDSKIQSPGVTTGCTMSLQPGQPWDGEFITLLSSSSFGQTVNVER